MHRGCWCLTEMQEGVLVDVPSVVAENPAVLRAAAKHARGHEAIPHAGARLHAEVGVVAARAFGGLPELDHVLLVNGDAEDRVGDVGGSHFKAQAEDAAVGGGHGNQGDTGAASAVPARRALVPVDARGLALARGSEDAVVVFDGAEGQTDISAPFDAKRGRQGVFGLDPDGKAVSHVWAWCPGWRARIYTSVCDILNCTGRETMLLALLFAVPLSGLCPRDPNQPECIISPPDHDGPRVDTYASNANCTFTLKAETSYDVPSFDIEWCPECSCDYLGPGLNESQKFCGDMTGEFGVYHSTEDTEFRFVSDGDVTGAGFKICESATATEATTPVPVSIEITPETSPTFSPTSWVFFPGPSPSPSPSPSAEPSPSPSLKPSSEPSAGLESSSANKTAERSSAGQPDAHADDGHHNHHRHADSDYDYIWTIVWVSLLFFFVVVGFVWIDAHSKSARRRITSSKAGQSQYYDNPVYGYSKVGDISAQKRRMQKGALAF